MYRSRTPTGGRTSSTPRGQTRSSPFRNVYQAKAPTSADSILSELSVGFDDKVLLIVRRRAEQIMSRYVRLNYLGREDSTVLEGCRNQCETFMGNVENCIRAAARRDECMSQSIVRRAYDQWKICNDLSCQITLILDGKTRKRPSPPRHATPQRLGGDRAGHNDLEELKSLQRLRHVDRETAVRVYDLCIGVYGQEKGHIEFVAWLSLMPPAIVQSLADIVF